jgi:hypothetical protein
MHNSKNYQNNYNFSFFESQLISALDAFELGYAVQIAGKQMARAARKEDEVEDLKKARWYLDREIEKRQRPQ